MRINSDFGKRAVAQLSQMDWMASPMQGVERKMLDRIGEEVARATSIVRYAPNSHFSPHTHGGGEEFYVLEGVFSDEKGDYPVGTYVRNPIGSTHRPHSEPGCTIFVKLHQFHQDDQQHVVVDTARAKFFPGQVLGLTVLPLHEHGTEHTALVRWAPGTRFVRHRHSGGEEVLVLDGIWQDEHGVYPAGTWIRSPHNSEHTPFSEQGCLIYVKVGHLHSAALFEAGQAPATRG
jgi:anti-sigma factor ChrR (cupin superfamily)